MREKVISYTTDNCHCILIVKGINNTASLSEENLNTINSIIEMSLNARYSVKDNFKKISFDDKGRDASSHKIKSVISSISTALELLMSPELSEDEKKHLKKLASRGVTELKVIIDDVSGASAPKRGTK